MLEQVSLLRDEQDGMMEGMEENTKAVAALRQKVDLEIKDHKQGTEKQLNLVRTDMARQLASLTHQFANGVSPLPQPTPAPTSGDSASWMGVARDEPLLGPSLSQHPAQAHADEGDVIKLLHKAVLPDPDAHDAHDAPQGLSPPDAPEDELGFQPDLRAARPLQAGFDDAMPLDLLLPGHGLNKSSPGSRLLARLTLKRCVSDDAVPASLRCAAIVVGKRLFLFPKGRDGMCDLQFAMVMDVETLRLWALRVMGSLPLRCRCAFVVVSEAICVFPCDAGGRLDLRQTFVLTSADHDRVYSQGCYVEVDTPPPSHCRCEVVKHLCFIFPHDGEHNYQMSQACVLDTELMTVRVCGKDLSYSTPEQLLGAQREGVDPSLGGGDEGKFHFEVCGSQMVCFPHTDRLECMVHLAWTATVSADGMSLDAASHQAADPLPPHVAAALAEKGVGAANARMTRRDVGMSSDGAVLALETRSKAVANVAGNGALPSETTLADGSQLRFIFKVVKSLSLVMLLPQDDQEGMDLSTLLALHCPEMAADTTGQEVLHQRGERVMLQTVAVSGDSLEALQGVRCSVHVVNSCLVFLPQDSELSIDLANIFVVSLSFASGAQGGIQAQVRHIAVDVPMACDDVGVFVHEGKLLLLPKSRGNSSHVCVLYPETGRYQLYTLDNLSKSTNGQEVLMCGSDLVFIPFDSSGRRCVGQVSVLDCNLVD
eukprot:Tamp_02710.p1 GENE.Tamp_02710~~Tamp_02710.p1  ORF type:complete len:710 (+),score=157.81 Tamp_02710:1745-3874(+)